MVSVIEKQQVDFMQGNCPIFNDQRVLRIPTVDQDEELIDINKMNHEGIEMLPTPTIPLKHPDYNAGFECSSFVRKSVWMRLIALYENLKKHNENVIIKIFEGLRTCDIQATLFNETISELEKEGLSREEAVASALKIINEPGSDSTLHATGACVDLRLFDKSKEEFLDCGLFGFAWFENHKNNQAFTFSANLTDEQKRNRSLLLTCAAMSGLVNYPYEWWHFSFGDRYFCYYTQNRTAVHKAL